MLLDTSGLLCFLYQSQPNHLEAVKHFESASHRLCHTLVLAELMAVCTIRKLNRILCIEFIQQLLNSPDVKVVDVTVVHIQKGLELLTERPDKEWSLCDAISMNLMDENSMTQALSTDHHFAQGGYTVLLKN